MRNIRSYNQGARDYKKTMKDNYKLWKKQEKRHFRNSLSTMRESYKINSFSWNKLVILKYLAQEKSQNANTGQNLVLQTKLEARVRMGFHASSWNHV